jgi:hypothetical protein
LIYVLFIYFLMILYATFMFSTAASEKAEEVQLRKAEEL